MLDLRKTGLCAAAIGCGVLAAAAASPLPELSPEKRQLHFQCVFVFMCRGTCDEQRIFS